MAVMYLRTNLTERQLAVVFDVSQKQVDRVLHDLVRLLGELIAPPHGATRALDRGRYFDPHPGPHEDCAL